MIADDHGHGQPFATFIHSGKDQSVLTRMLDALRDRLISEGVTGHPKTISVDDDDAEINAVEQCEWGKEGTRPIICIWHFFRSIKVNMIKKGVSAANKKAIMDDVCAILELKVCHTSFVSLSHDS